MLAVYIYTLSSQQKTDMIFVSENAAFLPPSQSLVGAEYGENLRRLMARVGLTIAQLAARSGLDQRTVQAILQGRNKRPHARTLQKLAAGLDASVDELFQNP